MDQHVTLEILWNIRYAFYGGFPGLFIGTAIIILLRRGRRGGRLFPLPY